MKNLRIMSILLAAAMVTSVAAGCKKEESEEPLVIYYSGEQQEGAVVTLQTGETGSPAAAQTEPLAPIIADRTQTTETSALPSMESQESETSQTETASEETAATTTAAAAAETQTGGEAASADVPVISGGSHIYDNAGVIADEGSVNSAMSSFESSTGVSPAIFTINNQLSGDDFRQYARDLYSTNFSDQDHVVVVYQLTPQGTWSWTCVFGSNTGTVFDQDTINTFQSDLTNAFSSSNVDTALVTTFNNAQPSN